VVDGVITTRPSAGALTAAAGLADYFGTTFTPASADYPHDYGLSFHVRRSLRRLTAVQGGERCSDTGGTDVTLADRSIGAFLDGVASEAVTPSGGAVAPVVGAMGTALCEMVCLHTDGDDTGDDATDLRTVRTELEERRERLLELAAEDADAVDAVGAAFAGDADAEQRRATAERATEVPLDAAETGLLVLERAVLVTEVGNPNAVPDGVTGALLVHAAVEASVATVRANLDMLDDDVAAEMDRRAEEVLEDADRAIAQVTAHSEP